MQRFFRLVSATNGFLAVALGAFGAHGLKSVLANVPDGARRLDWWETAAQYHLVHALGLGLVAAYATSTASAALRTAGLALQAGILLFSGSLYAMSLSGMTRLGMITPIGGLCFLVGWVALALDAWRRPTA